MRMVFKFRACFYFGFWMFFVFTNLLFVVVECCSSCFCNVSLICSTVVCFELYPGFCGMLLFLCGLYCVWLFLQCYFD